MTSKIINMAEQLKDEQDRMLEAMFASEPIADNGFSTRVVKRVRRRMLLRQITLPVATVLGLLVSFKPIAQLVEAMAGLIQLLPFESVGGTTDLVMAQLPILGAGGALLVALVIGMHLFAE